MRELADVGDKQLTIFSFQQLFLAGEICNEFLEFDLLVSKPRDLISKPGLVVLEGSDKLTQPRPLILEFRRQLNEFSLLEFVEFGCIHPGLSGRREEREDKARHSAGHFVSGYSRFLKQGIPLTRCSRV